MKNSHINTCLGKRSLAETCHVLAGQSCHFFFLPPQTGHNGFVKKHIVVIKERWTLLYQSCD